MLGSLKFQPSPGTPLSVWGAGARGGLGGADGWHFRLAARRRTEIKMQLYAQNFLVYSWCSFSELFLAKSEQISYVFLSRHVI